MDWAMGGTGSFSGSGRNGPVFPARENPAKLHQNFRKHSGVTKNIPKGTGGGGGGGGGRGFSMLRKGLI